MTEDINHGAVSHTLDIIRLLKRTRSEIYMVLYLTALYHQPKMWLNMHHAILWLDASDRVEYIGNGKQQSHLIK